MICGLGVGVDLERWGYAKEDIAESDWSDTVDLSDGFTAYIRTARHFSGRNLHRS
jgi:L-ascorbate metabolism protein UlaG (beta-lactamase superfamily)